MNKEYFVYILASKRNGTLYVGVTDDLIVRVNDHKKGTGGAFTRKYKIKILVHVESYPTPEEAIPEEMPQKMESRMEDRIDRGGESPLE